VDFTYISGKTVFFDDSFTQNTPDFSFINPRWGPYSWCSPF